MIRHGNECSLIPKLKSLGELGMNALGTYKSRSVTGSGPVSGIRHWNCHLDEKRPCRAFEQLRQVAATWTERRQTSQVAALGPPDSANFPECDYWRTSGASLGWASLFSRLASHMPNCIGRQLRVSPSLAENLRTPSEANLPVPQVAWRCSTRYTNRRTWRHQCPNTGRGNRCTKPAVRPRSKKPLSCFQ